MQIPEGDMAKKCSDWRGHLRWTTACNGQVRGNRNPCLCYSSMFSYASFLPCNCSARDLMDAFTVPKDPEIVKCEPDVALAQKESTYWEANTSVAVDGFHQLSKVDPGFIVNLTHSPESKIFHLNGTPSPGGYSCLVRPSC